MSYGRRGTYGDQSPRNLVRHSGAVIVEFAICLSLLVVLIFGSIDIALALRENALMLEAARTGALSAASYRYPGVDLATAQGLDDATRTNDPRPPAIYDEKSIDDLRRDLSTLARASTVDALVQTGLNPQHYRINIRSEAIDLPILADKNWIVVNISRPADRTHIGRFFKVANCVSSAFQLEWGLTPFPEPLEDPTCM